MISLEALPLKLFYICELLRTIPHYMLNAPVPLFPRNEPPPGHDSEVEGQSQRVVPASRTWLPRNGICGGKERVVPLVVAAHTHTIKNILFSQ